MLPGAPLEDAAPLRALPHEGKLVLVVPGGQTVAARYSLPWSDTRKADGEAALWLCVGGIAQGAALQLRVERMERPRERDRVVGAWFVYQPVRGALTLAT